MTRPTKARTRILRIVNLESIKLLRLFPFRPGRSADEIAPICPPMAINSSLFNLGNLLPLLRLLPRQLPFFLFQRPRPQLERVYPSRSFQLFLQ